MNSERIQYALAVGGFGIMISSLSVSLLLDKSTQTRDEYYQGMAPVIEYRSIQNEQRKLGEYCQVTDENKQRLSTIGVKYTVPTATVESRLEELNQSSKSLEDNLLVRGYLDNQRKIKKIELGMAIGCCGGGLCEMAGLLSVLVSGMRSQKKV